MQSGDWLANPYLPLIDAITPLIAPQA